MSPYARVWINAALLHRLMADLGLTPAALACRADVRKSTVDAILERGVPLGRTWTQRRVKDAIAAALARAMVEPTLRAL